MLLVDTNVLVDVLENDPDWAEWAVRQLRAQSQVHDLAINPIIHPEPSLTFGSVKALDDALAAWKLPCRKFRVPPCSSPAEPSPGTVGAVG